MTLCRSMTACDARVTRSPEADLLSAERPVFGIRAPLRPMLALLASIVLNACAAVGPDYVRPVAPTPASFKEAKGWKRMQPLDGFDRGPWWSVYRDAELSDLISQVNFSNQTVAADLAAYEASMAIVREAQASYFPTVKNSYGVTGARSSTGGVASTSTTFQPAASASWDLDVWGKVRRTVESNAASAQVSAADLDNARLSAQATLATDYFDLRYQDFAQGPLRPNRGRISQDFSKSPKINIRPAQFRRRMSSPRAPNCSRPKHRPSTPAFFAPNMSMPSPY